MQHETEPAAGTLIGAYVAGQPSGEGSTEVPPRPDEPPTPEASVDAVGHLLDEVEQALSRLDDGTYGECASCGGPIDDPRLDDDPTARECASCQSPTAG
jgi:DnaK suppressor protein